LAALRELKLLDSRPSPAFDRVTRVAATALDVPIMLISLVDESRQWFLSRVGLEAAETSRDVSFCAHAVYECRPLIVPDATEDVRFVNNPLVIGEPHIRAYAGMPIYTRAGYALGTLCAIDTVPRDFSALQMDSLQDCTFMIEDLVQEQARTLGLDRRGSD